MTIPKIMLSFKSWASFYFIPSLQLVDIHSTIIIYMINVSLFMTEDFLAIKAAVKWNLFISLGTALQWSGSFAIVMTDTILLDLFSGVSSRVHYVPLLLSSAPPDPSLVWSRPCWGPHICVDTPDSDTQPWGELQSGVPFWWTPWWVLTCTVLVLKVCCKKTEVQLFCHPPINTKADDVNPQDEFLHWDLKKKKRQLLRWNKNYKCK